MPNPSVLTSDTCAAGAANPANYPSIDIYGTTRPQAGGPYAGAMEPHLGVIFKLVIWRIESLCAQFFLAAFAFLP